MRRLIFLFIHVQYLKRCTLLAEIAILPRHQVTLYYKTIYIKTSFKHYLQNAHVLKKMHGCIKTVRVGGFSGGSMISEKGVRIYKGIGFAFLILSHFS